MERLEVAKRRGEDGALPLATSTPVVVVLATLDDHQDTTLLLLLRPYDISPPVIGTPLLELRRGDCHAIVPDTHI